jgi:hypothetical protein
MLRGPTKSIYLAKRLCDLSCYAAIRTYGNSRAASIKEAENTMARETILYISNCETCPDLIFAALEATGYEVVNTQSSTQAMAMEYIMHSVVAIVLHHQTGEQSSFDAAKSLRAFCPNVPIILLCHDELDRLPSYIDACVCTGQSLEKVTSEVRSLLSAKRLLVHGAQC